MARYQKHLDADAFRQLVAHFLAPGLAVARQLVSEQALAEDAVQEAFLRIVRGRERYDAAKPFAPWFYAILRNVCTDMLRRQARQAKAMAEIARRTASDGSAPPSHELDAMDLLARLPDAARAVLTLRVVHDLSFRDVAAALGIGEEAAKKRAQRALRQLRELCSRQAVQRSSPPPTPALVASARQKDVPDQAS